MTEKDRPQEVERPPRPAPLDPRSEASRARWRAYLEACARADSALLAAHPDRTDTLGRRLN